MRAMFLLATVAAATGCTVPSSFEGDGDVRADVAPATYRVDGVVAIERVRTIDGAQTSVGAKFMRHTGLDLTGRDRTGMAGSAGDGGPDMRGAEAAERLVSSRLLLPASGECASVTDLEDGDAENFPASMTGGGSLGPEAEVELIDVGDVALVTDLVAADLALRDRIGPEAVQPFLVRLAPRAFPDVGELVSGVFYTSPDLAAPLPAPGQYAIEGTGAAAAPPFEVQAEAPAEPGDVTLDGIELASASARRGADLLVSWSQADRSQAERGLRGADRIYVDVQAADGNVHRCAFEDSGSAVLPGALITTPSIAIAVHRLRETTTPLPAEIDDEPGQVLVRFDLAVVGRVPVAASSTASRDGG